jgi:hypothetical protein
LGLAAALVLVLFPFDWLATVWPAYHVVFARVFATALAHHIGHAAVFCSAGLLLLNVWPALRARPWPYAGLMVGGALAQEALQSLFKHDPPNLGDGRDVLFDLLGVALAFLLVWVWGWARRRSNAHGTPG